MDKEKHKENKGGNKGGNTIKPTNDLAFKKTFSSSGNEDILAGLIEDFLDFRPKSITIIKPYNIKELRLILQKVEEGASDEEQAQLIETISDVKADLVTSGFTAEMQIRQHSRFDARSLYYPCLDFCDRYNFYQNKYQDLRPIYSLNILDESCFRHPAAVKCFELYDPYLGIPMDNEYFRIVYLELRKEGVRNEHQRFWQKFFRGEELGEGAPDYIRKAKNVIDLANFGKEEREMLSALEKYQADQESLLLGAEEKGLAQGLAQGKLEVAQNLKAAGVEKALILECVGISEEEYDAL